ncbi:MAG: DUF2569 family protein [Spirochaetales bacterium]|nr:DUF2569 family protein [Spirochaetales bacterium]
MAIKKERQNLGGILVLAVFSFILSVFLSWGSIGDTILPFSFDQRWIAISDLSLSTYNESWVNFVIFILIENVLIVFFTLILFVLFVKQSKHFPKTLLIYFLTRLIFITLVFYLQTVIKGPPTPELKEILSGIFRALIIPGIWIPFILLSEKSSEIFIQ